MIGRLAAGAAVSLMLWSRCAAADPPAPVAAPGPPDIEGATAMLQLFNADVKPTVKNNLVYLNVVTTPGRTQLVYVSPGVYGLAYALAREVSANVVKFTGPVDPALLQRLMVENDRMLPSASWALTPGKDGGQYLVLEAFLPTNASADMVQQAVKYVALTADTLEAELTGKDDF